MPDSPPLAPSSRLVSLDAYRGFVMLLMAAEILQIPNVAKHFPDSLLWGWLAFNNEHVAWSGGLSEVCSLHDLIQPSFSFMVGVALPFSLAARSARGQSWWWMLGHALWRSLLLILLGVLLRSAHAKQTYWTFEDTLSQIGMGYPFLFLLGFLNNRLRCFVLLLLLTAYWGFFAHYEVPADWTPAMANVPAGWAYDFQGFASHWNLNHNPAWAFDRWFLNLFPRAEPFIGHPSGYSTLNFIPTLGTMLLGLIAGKWLKEREAPMQPALRLFVAGAVCFFLGVVLHTTGVCPIIKKIWTPSWTLYSGGWCCWLMAAFYLLIDVTGWKAWAFPLVVIGMNSIAMYFMAHSTKDYVGKTLDIHFGTQWTTVAGPTFVPMLHGAAVLLGLWLILLWMYRRRLFLKI